MPLKHSDSAAMPGLWWHSSLEIRLPLALRWQHQLEICAYCQKPKCALKHEVQLHNPIHPVCNHSHRSDILFSCRYKPGTSGVMPNIS